MERIEHKDLPGQTKSDDASTNLFAGAYDLPTTKLGSHTDSTQQHSEGLVDTLKSAWNSAASILSNFSLISEAKADTLIDTGGGGYVDANDGSYIPYTIDQGGNNYYVPSQGRTVHKDN